MTVACRQLEATAAHEIAHAALAGRSLPAWLNEGIAMVAMEPFTEGEFLRGALRWPGDLDTFWTGEAFHLPDDCGGGLAHDLAYLLAKALIGRDRAAFAEFVLTADPGDAGNAACSALFGVRLEDLASTILGEGDWAPPGGLS